ncbi:MAG TPA: family 10 glycosylhydrolase, partial [Gemmataceae bacterium]|nr:family 10 glycosylhydrolase [Gemmataceae bacterium]
MTRLLGSLLLICGGLSPAFADEPAPPTPPREFRGVWVASVSNIDWPSQPGLPVDVQKKELLAILDRAEALNLNAVILQVRPMCDALYASKLEPWSEFLSGQAGKAPEPNWDPLVFAVAEAHKRGIELHAWFNPYRARHPSAKTDLPPDHLVKKRPDLAKEYGKHHWLNPTSKEVQDHSVAVILDVVSRYDVDGI